MSANARFLLFIVQLAGALLGMTTGIAAACGVVPDGVGFIGWIVSTISLMRLLTVRRNWTSDDADPRRPYSIGTRMLSASIAVFCISILAIWIGANIVNPAALSNGEKIAITIFIVLGGFATAASILMTRR